MTRTRAAPVRAKGVGRGSPARRHTIPTPEARSNPSNTFTLALDECENVSVELVRLGLRQAVWAARIDLDLGALDDLRSLFRRRLDRNDLVVIAMDHERRLVDLLEILCVVDLGEFTDAVILTLDAAHHALKPEGFAQAFVDRRAISIKAIERNGEILEELRAVAAGVLA